MILPQEKKETSERKVDDYFRRLEWKQSLELEIEQLKG